MNILSFKTATIFIVLLIASGCDFKSATTPSEAPSLDIEAIAQEIGRQHNASLNYILKNLKDREEAFENRQQAIDFFEKSAVDFIEQSLEIDRMEIHEYLQMERVLDETTGPGNKSTAASHRINVESLNLRSQQIDHLKNLFEISRPQQGTDYFAQDLPSAIKAYNQNIDPASSPEEKLVLEGVGAIMSASFTYWKEHRNEWISELQRLQPDYSPNAGSAPPPVISSTPCYFGMPLFTLCIAIDWGKVIQEDGGGLVAGVWGVAAAAFAAGGPPGWLATAVILGSSAGAFSSYEIYSQLMELMS